MTLLLDELLLVAGVINDEAEPGTRLLRLPPREHLGGLEAFLDSTSDLLDGPADPPTKAGMVFCNVLEARPLTRGNAWLAVTLATLVLEEHGLTLKMGWVELYSLAEFVAVDGHKHNFYILSQTVIAIIACRSHRAT